MGDMVKSLQATIERIILDPKYHDLMMLIKSARNGVVYGTKVRFPHALVMIFLFRSGTFREKLRLVLKATRQHARNLGTFVFLYKSGMLSLRYLNGKQGHYDSFFAGLFGGYAVFGRGNQSSVNQQIVIYVFARVALGLAKLAVQPRGEGKVVGSGGGFDLVSDPKLKALVLNNSWPVFASMSWALVMYLFQWHPEVLQPSLRGSMTYLYTKSEHWDGLRNFLWHNE